MVKNTKRQKRIAKLGIKNIPYSLQDAFVLLAKYKETCAVNFDETVELSFSLGIDPRHSDQMVRGAISLPAGTGKDVKVAVFAPDDMLDSLKDCGADIVGSDDFIESIKNGAKIDFDNCVSVPSYMPKLAKIAKILGPKGLMPNPKLGTVTNDVKRTVLELKSGKVEFRAEKSGIVHAGIGKLSFDFASLEKNINFLSKAVVDSKPSGAKGEYLKNAFISTTMGPSIELDIKALLS